MPTKPLNNTPIFASDEFYTVGPKVGRLTKSTDLGAALATQGNVPGKDFPTAANEDNAWLNTSSLLTDWLFQGSNQKTDSANVVETDSNGGVNVSKLDCGDTDQTGPAALFQKNITGPVVKIINNDGPGEALEIQSTSTTSGSPESISITNDRSGFSSHMIAASTTAGPDSLGGIFVGVSSSRTLATSSVTSRELAAVNAVNGEGLAIEAIGSSLLQPAMRALNTKTGGVNLRVGFGNEDTVPSNVAGLAIESRGGDGDPEFGNPGGNGLDARGGDAVNGSIDAMGGHGVFAKGGDSANQPGGFGLHCQSTGNNSTSLFVEHESTSNSTDLAIFDTRDNNATAIVVNCPGSGNGLEVRAEGGHGLLIQQTPSGGGVIAAAISLLGQIDPTFTNPGDIWLTLTGSGGGEQLRINSDGVKQYIPRTANVWCAATTFISSATQVNSATLVDIATLSFAIGQIPNDVGTIIIKATGGINGDGSNEVGLALRDETAATQIHSRTIQLATDGTSDQQVRDATIVFEYVLPAAGARTFKLQYNLPATSTGTFNQALSWLFEIYAKP